MKVYYKYKQKYKLKMLLSILTLLTCTYGQKYSSHQIYDYPINMKYDNNSGSPIYSLSLSMMQYDSEIPQIIYCFKKMEKVPHQNNQNCDLVEAESSYRCVQVKYANLWDADINWDLLTYQQWEIYWEELDENAYTTESKLFQFSEQDGIVEKDFFTVPNQSFKVSVNVTFQKNERLVNFSADFLVQSQIYHMITAENRQILLAYDQWPTPAKQNYLHTYIHPKYYDTLIVQSHYHCILYKDKTVYIFEGAVDRGQLPHYFTGILTVDNNWEPFNMWGGYSYSSSHAARDMMAYESNTKAFYDLYSLYAAAPFQDIATNINGEKNVVRIGNSGSSSSQWAYHFIQFYRLFNTEDTNGDEIIRQKIYNKFCFAAYFTDVQSVNFTVLSESFKHQLIDCHIPILSIFESILKSSITILLMICYLFFQ